MPAFSFPRCHRLHTTRTREHHRRHQRHLFSHSHSHRNQAHARLVQCMACMSTIYGRKVTGPGAREPGLRVHISAPSRPDLPNVGFPVYPPGFFLLPFSELALHSRFIYLFILFSYCFLCLLFVPAFFPPYYV